MRYYRSSNIFLSVLDQLEPYNKVFVDREYLDVEAIRAYTQGIDNAFYARIRAPPQSDQGNNQAV